MLNRTMEDLWRELAPQVLGALVRRYGHFDIAEDAVQEALLAAAVQWPEHGVPDEPRTWLIRIASRKMIDCAVTRRAVIVRSPQRHSFRVMLMRGQGRTGTTPSTCCSCAATRC